MQLTGVAPWFFRNIRVLVGNWINNESIVRPFFYTVFLWMVTGYTLSPFHDATSTNATLYGKDQSPGAP